MPISDEKLDDLKKQLHEINFSDPLSETSKKAKRNLVLISFIGLIISAYSVKIDTFLGFRIINSSISDQVLNGMIAAILLYFLILYVFNFVIDLSAWNFRTERIKIDPYLNFLEDTIAYPKLLTEKIDTFKSNTENIYSEIPPDTEKNRNDIVRSTSQDIIKIRNFHDDYKKNTLPELLEDHQKIRKLSQVNLRYIARIFFLLVIDILLPIGLCIIALVKTYANLGDFFGIINL